jgi:hypothetical protein
VDDLLELGLCGDSPKRTIEAIGGREEILLMDDISQIVADKDTTIAPLLSVWHGVDAIEFYKAAFRASELVRVDGDDGSVVAQLSLGEAKFWVADESPEHLNFSLSRLAVGQCAW